ncbi:MAG TPA: MoxR family ATPase, partial [Acidobacteriota bacterium]|nr:MoxR family ATPase [Acidobacteriota bacterium]
EHEVTAGGETFHLDEPFFVLATQNPIEQEGTYPLPEAQLDRFMFNIFVDYPDEAEENTIVRTTTSAATADLKTVMDAAGIKALQQLVRRVPVAEHVISYAVGLARATRPNENSPLPYIKDWVSWGAGPRAGQYLILGSKCRAILDGRPTPSIEDVRAVARPVFRHRIVTSFNAEADGISTLDIVEKLLADVKAKE